MGLKVDYDQRSSWEQKHDPDGSKRGYFWKVKFEFFDLENKYLKYFIKDHFSSANFKKEIILLTDRNYLTSLSMHDYMQRRLCMKLDKRISVDADMDILFHDTTNNSFESVGKIKYSKLDRPIRLGGIK